MADDDKLVITPLVLEDIHKRKTWMEFQDQLHMDFEPIFKEYFEPAELVLIECRYAYSDILQRYHCEKGRETNDFVFTKHGFDWKFFSLDEGTSSGRGFSTDLFYPRTLDGSCWLEEVADKLYFVLHDVTKERVFEMIEGFNPDKVFEAEIEEFGYILLDSWKKYLDFKIREKYRRFIPKPTIRI